MTGSHEHEPLPEGEEHAPPGARTMAVVRWGLVALMALAAGGAWIDHAWTARSERHVAGVQFICPMHPQIIADQKGECPICGMDLVPAGSAGTRVSGEARPGEHDGHPAPPEGAARPPGLAAVDLAADRVQLIGVKTAVASRQALAVNLRAVGYVAANEGSLLSLSTRYSGWVETLTVSQTGQLVQKGEVLATVYSPEMLNAQQVFLNAIKWSERKPGAATGGGSPPPSVASDLERDARVRLELLGVASEDIDLIAQAGLPQRAVNVRAPVRGYVARKSVLRGLFIQSGTELFQLADLSTVWVLVDVPEGDIPRVRVGQKATFEVRAWPGERFTGQVQFIYPALNAGSRTLQARVELHNGGLKLRPGMFGDVTLDLGATQAVVVPVEALIDSGEVQYVFVDLGHGRFEPRQVKVGAESNGKVAVLDGLADGETVVTTANFLLDSESRLRAAVEGFSGAPAKPHAAPKGAGDPAPAKAAPAGAPLPGHDHAHGARYTCPMHPEFVTDDPKARCPQCGMKLVPVAAGPAKSAAAGEAMPTGAAPAAGH